MQRRSWGRGRYPRECPTPIGRGVRAAAVPDGGARNFARLAWHGASYTRRVMETDLVIRLITEFRDDMNRRFERMEQRSDHRFDQLELKLMREIGKVNERL